LKASTVRIIVRMPRILLVHAIAAHKAEAVLAAALAVGVLVMSGIALS
jgi:hypothetical protein